MAQPFSGEEELLFEKLSAKLSKEEAPSSPSQVTTSEIKQIVETAPVAPQKSIEATSVPEKVSSTPEPSTKALQEQKIESVDITLKQSEEIIYDSKRVELVPSQTIKAVEPISEQSSEQVFPNLQLADSFPNLPLLGIAVSVVVTAILFLYSKCMFFVHFSLLIDSYLFVCLFACVFIVSL